MMYPGNLFENVENCKLLKKKMVEVEPFTFIFILTIWFNTSTKNIEKRNKAL